MYCRSWYVTALAVCVVLAWHDLAWAADLSGRAYEGQVGDESKQLAGVTVSLYGSVDRSGPRTQIGTTTTDSSGWYGLTAQEGFEYYFIVAESGPDANYSFEGASSVDGSVSGNEIQYSVASQPLSDQTLTGNRFWYSKDTTAPPAPGANNPPDAKDDLASTALNTAVDINVLANDTDPDGDPLHVNSATDPAHGTVVNHGTHVTYTPEPGYSGTDSFQYTAGDGRGGTDTATVTVNVDDAGGPEEPPGGLGVLDGYKRDSDSGVGLSGWRIYIDLNGNGQWDGGEPSDVTGGDGYYRMGDVEPGTYRVCEVMQAGWEGDHPCVEGVAILPGVTTTQDFHNRRVGGEQPPAGTGAIRGAKFNDLNGNGQRDAGEPGLAGWVIVLQDGEGNLLAQTTTDANGNCEFSNLEEGVYRVDEEQQAGWRQTYPEVDGQPAYWAITLEPGDDIEEADFGNTWEGGGASPDGPGGGSVTIVKRATPADDTPFQFCVDYAPGGFFDVLCQNLQDPSSPQWTVSNPALIEQVTETVPAGWTLKNITVSGDTDQGSAVDLSQGRVDLDYDEGEDLVIVFENIKEGHDELDYGDAPASYGIASHDVGGVHLGPAIDSESQALTSANADGDDLDNTDDEDGITLASDLVRGQRAGIAYEYFFGPQGPVGNGAVAIWIDYNQDGVFHNSDERVILTGGMVVQHPQYCRVDGGFDVPATAKLGKTFMRVRAVVGSGAALGATGHGGEGEVEDHQVTIKDGGDVLPPGEIVGGAKFHDLNGNGVFDVGEPGLPGWTIWIDLNGNGAKDAGEGTLTNPDGNFYFTVLADGTYTVHEEMQAGWTQTHPGGAGTQTVTVQAGKQTASILFGNRRTSGPGAGGEIIHGYKWNDLDGDGLWDVAQPVEPPLAGWTIWLDMNGNGVQDGGDLTTQTDAIGHFVFPAVASGTYVVGEAQQSGWTQTAPSGGIHTVTVQGGQGSNPLLFGNRQSGVPGGGAGTIWAGKWNDLDGDGIYSLSEPLLANWQMYLDLNQNGQLDPGEPSQMTDGNGECRFTGLADGVYVLAEVMQPGWQQTQPGGAGTYTVTVMAGGAVALSMFGNQQTGGPGPGPGPQYDWGDAPDPTYATLGASNGAYHTIVPGVSLGGCVDAEPDGQPHPDALGDDSNVDDEDGIFFLTPLVPGASAEIEVVVPTTGKLDAWIDFGADGGWAEAPDQIFTAKPIVPGSTVLAFQVPAGAVTDVPTYARFRFSSAGGLSPTGGASDGEVEDYCLVLGEHGPAVAGEPGPPHIKWSQPPIESDMNVEAEPVFCGWGEPARSTQEGSNRRQWRMDADDFRCLGPIPVTRIRWWGTYKAWSQPGLPEGQPEAWHIGIWANQVEGLNPNESYLERLVWSVEVPFERVNFAPVGRSEFPGRLPETCFVYELGLEPEEWFHQAEFESHAGIFWISITAIYPPGVSNVNMWGWHTRPHIWGRGAVMPAIMGEWPSEDERLFPGRIYPVESDALCGTNQGFDMCFELLTEEPWIKWDQPFTGVRDWPWYASEMGFGRERQDGERIGSRLVADDWICERQDPVVAMSWHGSYLGYGYEACQCEPLPEPRPDYFLLAIYTSLPPGGLESYDHPGEKIWEYVAHEYDEVLVGYDTSFEGEPNEPVFRYSVRLPEEAWFRQTERGTVYWFTVTPVLREPTRDLDRPYQWGWTNHPQVSGGGALFVDYRLRTVPQWQDVRDSQDEAVDMSFEFFTVPLEMP